MGISVNGSNDSVIGSGTVTGFAYGISVVPPNTATPSSGNRLVNVTAVENQIYWDVPIFDK